MTEKIIESAWQTEIDAATKLHQNGQYTNLMLNEYKGVAGIAPGEFLTVRKDDQYAEPFANTKTGQYGEYTMYNTSVMVGDKKASFIMFNDEEAASFTAAGGVGDTIQISKEEFSYVDKKKNKRIKERLVFRPLEE